MLNNIGLYSLSKRFDLGLEIPSDLMVLEIVIVKLEQVDTDFEAGKVAIALEEKKPIVICKSTHLENYIPMVMSLLKHTSPPSMAATFLTTRLMAALQLSGYFVFHDGVTPIQLGLP